MSRFSGKAAVVTGGARGIGAALARAFSAAGADVGLLDLDAETAEQTARSLPGRAWARSCDVSDRAAVEAAIEACECELEGIDILVNNAGRHTSAYNRPVTALSEQEWREAVDTNILGVVNCSTAAAPAMRRRGGGAILNIGSVSGFDVRTAYGVTKLAVRGLTVALAEELAPAGIRVNSLAPGLIPTETIRADLPAERAAHFVDALQLIKREGRAADLVGMALLLCSEDASFITGETVIVGGGFARRV